MRAALARAAPGIALAVAACAGSSGQPAPQSPPGRAPAVWAVYRHLAGVVDLAGPRSDGSFLVTAAGRLFVLGRGGTVTPFARGPGGYRAAPGTEPYLAVTSGTPVQGGRCQFGNGTVFALAPGSRTTRPGVIMVDPRGRARPFASLRPGLALSGIAFDATGRFGHQLLVTARSGHRATVLAIGCGGRVSTVAAGAPVVEGGIAVAPASFGAFGGDLIAPNELGGQVYAIAPSGTVMTLVRSGLAAGPDTGVESAGFVPPGAAAAYVADRLTPGNRHPGDNAILRLSATDFARARIRAGDLLVATEGGARTIDVRCAAACTARYVAAGPAVAHGEGHIVFTP